MGLSQNTVSLVKDSRDEATEWHYTISACLSAEGICYPEISYGTEKDIVVNASIHEEIISRLSELFGEDYSSVIRALDYSITFQSEEYICILFEGIAFNDGAAHPHNFAFSLVVSLSKSTLIDIATLLKIDDEFVLAFRKQLEANANPSRFSDEDWKGVSDYISSFSNMELHRILSSNSGTVFAMLTDGVVVLFPVPYAIGDYVKVNVPINGAVNWF